MYFNCNAKFRNNIERISFVYVCDGSFTAFVMLFVCLFISSSLTSLLLALGNTPVFDRCYTRLGWSSSVSFSSGQNKLFLQDSLPETVQFTDGYFIFLMIVDFGREKIYTRTIECTFFVWIWARNIYTFFPLWITIMCSQNTLL